MASRSPAWGAFRRRSGSARRGQVRRDRSDGADDRRRAGLGQGARGLGQDAGRRPGVESGGAKDRRFAAPEWRDNPLFDTIRQTYLPLSDQLLGSVDEIEGVDDDDAAEAAVRDPELRRRDEPVQFRADQPAGAQADDRDQGREPAQGPRQHAQRHRRGAADPDQAGRVRGRPQHRDDAGQGGQRDAALPADPVHADDRRGARDAAGRSSRRGSTASTSSTSSPRKASSNGRRPGPDRCSWSAGNRPTRASPTPALDDYVLNGPGRRDRHGPRRCSASRAVHAIGYCVAGTTLAATLAYLDAQGRGGQGQVARPSSPPRSISPKPATSSCSSATRRWSCSTSSPPTRAISTAATWPRPSTCCAAAT